VKFNKSWEEVAKNKPKEMYDAQLKWYKKNVEDPTAATLSKLDVSKEIYSNPASFNLFDRQSKSNGSID
jgi:hypothetical protein